MVHSTPPRNMENLRTPASQKKKEEQEGNYEERPDVHKHVCHEFNKENTNFIQHPNVTVVGQLKVGEGVKSKLDNGGQQNLDSEELKLGNREEPKVGNGGQPNVDRGQPNTYDGGQPNVDGG